MSYHVLIAEDEEVTREAVRAGVSAVLPGAFVHAVKNGLEAVRCAGQWEIEMAFLDIRMPEMNGITAAQKIRELRPDAQLVFLTAYDDFEYVRSALKLDVVDYLLKPFDQGTLAEAVQKMRARIDAQAGWQPVGNAGLEPGSDEPSRWLEEPAVEELLAGKLPSARIPAGLCGCIAALTGVEEGQMQRLRHLLTGLDLGGDIRFLAGRRGPYLFVAAWSMVLGSLQEQVKRQMDLLAARLGRQFGIRLKCGISGVFLDDGDIPEACLDAVCQLLSCGGEVSARVSAHRMQGDLIDVLTDGGLDELAREEIEEICALFPQVAKSSVLFGRGSV